MSEDTGLLTAENPVAETDWREGVSKEVRFSSEGNDKLAKFPTPIGCATSYLELESSMSSKVNIPTEDTTPEERGAFFKRLGRPEKAEDYTLPELAEGEAYDQTMMSGIKQQAFADGMSNVTFESMVRKYSEESASAQDRESVATEDALKQEWAGDFDKNIEISRRAIRELAPEGMKDDLLAVVKGRNLDNNLVFVKFLNSVGSKMLDDKLETGETVPKEDDYRPAYPSSPEMYRNGEDEESIKGKAWHVTNGYVY